ncbi:MAG: asparagine synthase (glutamine-hydrolyzing) [Candidatus Contendobacter sp.]|nr:asparagine synthase (glutamine-hydrolyzing) [Candidatus Contendobacter sp.]MDS4057877.1 asparagine synthase (glutamine-hydrolyzing) [Candidatus Contendobacter sp.]
MSGIAGIIHFDGKPVEPGLIEKMTSAMAHRGPDGVNHWVKGSVALGQCMLRTTPESLEEHQPLTNEDESLVLVMDGRVDNWEELRRELLGRGAVLRNRADAELVLRAYEIWGRDCLAHIDGDFALVIWDARRREAFCARDRMGHKPFNYHWDGKTFVFASELHTILALPWVPEIPNEGMLAEFLADEWYSKKETFWKGILRLVESNQMEVDRDGLRMERYWQPDFTQMLPFRSDVEYIEYYHMLFSDTVRRLSRSHQPVAFEVSGGLDSSAVFGMAEQLRCLQTLPAPGIQGYTLAFPNDKNANELEYSRAVSEYWNVEICEVPPTVAPLSWYWDWAAFYREFPGYPNGVMSWDLRRIATNRGCKVLLGGSGGDEWVGSWKRRLYYAEELVSRRWRNLSKCFTADCHEAGIIKSIYWLIRFGVVPLLPLSMRQLIHLAFNNLYQDHMPATIGKNSWLTPTLQQNLAKHQQIKKENFATSVSRVGQIHQQWLLAYAFITLAAELEERLSARGGLELRHPMRAPQIVQFAISTPERLRIRGQTDKFMHVKAMQDILPTKVLQRRTKADFSILFQEYLKHMDKELTQHIPSRHPEWIVADKMDALYKYYQKCLAIGDLSNCGKIQWIFWNALGCYMVF